MTRTGMFFSEFIASALLMFMIYAIKDDHNIGAKNLAPLVLFFIIFGIGACFGWETGYGMLSSVSPTRSCVSLTLPLPQLSTSPVTSALD
jgi:glycerol uptake facilitator-like aquaporin